jgi:methylenetetrahydrofolate reductase (NADPH)
MVNATKTSLEQALKEYARLKIDNIMALRGDPGPTGTPTGHAIELVQLIRQKFPQMGIGVAGFPEGHPECPQRLREMDYLKAKVDAGANYICTQLFFDNHDFYDFRERCIVAGIKVPIIAGIMPITSIASMQRMADLALGMRYPGRLLKAIKRATSPEGVAEIGRHWASEQVRDLLDNQVAGIHFYTLNRSTATRRIWQGLGIGSSQDLQNER